MGLTVEELALVIERCGSHPWLGVCLDSCHLYASGIDVGDPAAVDAMLDELDERSGSIASRRCTSTTRRWSSAPIAIVTRASARG